jgi:hypothetical protein
MAEIFGTRRDDRGPHGLDGIAETDLIRGGA